MTEPHLLIPNAAYYAIGVLVLTNIGTIVSLVIVGFKATWWLSKLDSRINEAKAMAIRTHKRIDQIIEKITLNQGD